MGHLDAWLDKALDSDSSAPQKEKKPKPKKRSNKQRSELKRKRNHKKVDHKRPSKQNHPKRNNPFKRFAGPKVDHKHTKAPIVKDKLRIITVGGLNEVGKNMTVLEYEDDIIIIDCGIEFPNDTMMGVDYVIPDTSYLEARKDRVRGVIITHGHLDHIGALPFVLPKLGFPPVYSTKLTDGFIEKRAEEFGQMKQMKNHVIHPDDVIKLGKFKCKFFRVMHSIPDSIAVDVDTPVGRVVHSGDYKFDETPHHNVDPAEVHKMEAIGKENILVFMSESTNALKPGHSVSEKEVGDALEKAVGNSTHRVIVATFSSQISRLQQIADTARKHNRKIFVSGRSMRNNIEIAIKHNYLKVPKGIFQDVKLYKKSNIPDHQALILTTGSQGEEVAALTRMAKGEHPHVKIKPNDTVIFSSSPIVGNERAIYNTFNKLTILGAHVIHNKIMDVHTSGHGNQDELARMINYIKPKYLIPIHGEYYMRTGLKHIAMERCNLSEDNIVMMVNGSVTEATKDGRVYKTNEQLPARYILIDGKGEGHMDSHVQKDRQIMAKNGIINVLLYVSKKSKKLRSRPEIISRGFMYTHER